MPAKALLATVRPRDVAGRTRRALAVELLAEIVVLDRRLKHSEQHRAAAAGSTLIERLMTARLSESIGSGRSRAACLLELWEG